jgi:hypothetical protein
LKKEILHCSAAVGIGLLATTIFVVGAMYSTIAYLELILPGQSESDMGLGGVSVIVVMFFVAAVGFPISTIGAYFLLKHFIRK